MSTGSTLPRETGSTCAFGSHCEERREGRTVSKATGPDLCQWCLNYSPKFIRAKCERLKAILGDGFDESGLMSKYDNYLARLMEEQMNLREQRSEDYLCATKNPKRWDEPWREDFHNETPLECPKVKNWGELCENCYKTAKYRQENPGENAATGRALDRFCYKDNRMGFPCIWEDKDYPEDWHQDSMNYETGKEEDLVSWTQEPNPKYSKYVKEEECLIRQDYAPGHLCSRCAQRMRSSNPGHYELMFDERRGLRPDYLERIKQRTEELERMKREQACTTNAS